ncbi:Fic family protein [Ascidiimonas aurantiaca]|uniref:Fic family protein n=1 Tax=Ascidiimonas aurantiaca TaxID=1685432 RepID=UPI0030EC9FB1
MELPKIIIELDKEKEKLDTLRPLTQIQRERLEQKLRLDWNYHSNSIEGNTLTAHETKAFILHGITAKGKPFRDYIEMRGHNEALKKLLGLVDKDVLITEKLIKELHEIILVEPYQDEKTEINPGVYKTKPNYLYTINNERIDFLPPEEVPEALNTLINWLNNQLVKPKRKKKKYNLHPVLVAAAFQVRFIKIHPFGDGNGRLSRILGNLILMQCGYTPAIIRLENREEYYRMLNLSSLEDPLPLAEMIAAESLKTTQQAIKAARNEPVNEPEDLDKELQLLEQKINNPDFTASVPKRSIALINKVLLDAFLPMMFEYDRQWARLRDKFAQTVAEIRIADKPPQKYEWLPDQKEEYWKGHDLDKIKYFDFLILLKDFKPLLPEQKDFSMGFALYFYDYKFEIEHHYGDPERSTFVYGQEMDRTALQNVVKTSVHQLIKNLSLLVDKKNNGIQNE